MINGKIYYRGKTIECHKRRRRYVRDPDVPVWQCWYKVEGRRFDTWIGVTEFIEQLTAAGVKVGKVVRKPSAYEYAGMVMNISQMIENDHPSISQMLNNAAKLLVEQANQIRDLKHRGV